MRSFLLLVALASTSLLACAHSKPAPAPPPPAHTITCDQVATKLLELSVAEAMEATRAANPGATDDQLAGAQQKLEAQAATQHDTTVQQCDERDMAEPIRQCILAAATFADAKTCSTTPPAS